MNDSKNDYKTASSWLNDAVEQGQIPYFIKGYLPHYQPLVSIGESCIALQSASPTGETCTNAESLARILQRKNNPQECFLISSSGSYHLCRHEKEALKIIIPSGMYLCWNSGCAYLLPTGESLNASHLRL